MTKIPDPSIQDLRDLALDLFRTGIQAANPQHGLRKAFAEKPPAQSDIGRTLVISLGKAAIAMARTCLSCLPTGKADECLIVTNYENAEHAPHLPDARLYASGHPVPDKNGLEASRALIACLETTTSDDHVIVLISGGGSALVPAPIEGVSLEDKIEVSKLLLDNGYTIHEMNLIRQTLSQLKGGDLSALASPATVDAYILSDVVGDDLSVIASGPTSPPLGNAADALRLFAEKGLLEQVPTHIRDALAKRAGDVKPDLSNTTNHLIGSNRISLDSILSDLPDGWNGAILDDLLEGDVEEVAPKLLEQIRQAPKGQKSALIWGGETTVTLKGTGRGGRNQELALRLAALAETNPIDGRWIFLSGGTDGRDGPTDSAGGLVDANTISRIREEDCNINKLLTNNDSYKALTFSQDHIMIGATGTNVADIQICLIDRT